MDNTVSLKDLFGHILKKWPLLLVCILVFAVLLNVYGVRKEVSSGNASEKIHEEYIGAAPELPAYFTEELYRLKTSLSEADAALCEAYADVYRNYIAEYKAGTLINDTERLGAYMTFLASYKDVLSVFGSTQRAYYNALISADMGIETETGAAIETFEQSVPETIQPKWAAKGALAGLIAGCLIAGLPYIAASGKNRKETCV